MRATKMSANVNVAWASVILTGGGLGFQDNLLEARNVFLLLGIFDIYKKVKMAYLTVIYNNEVVMAGYLYMVILHKYLA